MTTAAAVWGAFFSGLLSRSDSPSSTCWISARIKMRASQKRSSSSLDSDYVGSTMIVPGTGNDTVGAWNP